MNYQGIVYALLRAVGMETVMLTERLLQEKGVAVVDTYAIYRYALIPAIIWSLIFVRIKDLTFIFHTPKLLFIFGTLIVLWNLQALLFNIVVNSTSSMVVFSTIFDILSLPLYLAFGTFINHDAPNAFSLVAIVTLFIALLINPAHHRRNLRPRLSKPLFLIVLIILAKVSCDTINDGITREALKQLHPAVFLGVFAVTTLSACELISWRSVKPRHKGAKAMKKNHWLALLVPMVWFAASIPETFAFAALPIYVVISLGAATFIMDTFSDLIHRRIRLNARTFSFLTLVLTGIGLIAFSVR